MYNFPDAISIDLPVRTWEYRDPIPKILIDVVFSDLSDRGVMQLHAVWPRIQAEVPDASLVITSDWRLWADWQSEESIRGYKLSYAMQPNVTYLGAVRRQVNL